MTATYTVVEVCRCGGQITAAGPMVGVLLDVVGSFRVEHALCRATADEIAAAGEAPDREAGVGDEPLVASPAAAPGRVVCGLCGGEGVVGGLVVDDRSPAVDERCGRCGGRGWTEGNPS